MSKFNDNNNNDDQGDEDNNGQEFLDALDRTIIAGFDYIIDLPVDLYNALIKDWVSSKDYPNLIRWESLMQLESSSPSKDQTFEDRKNLSDNYALAKQSAGQELFRLYTKYKNNKKHGKK